MAMEARIIRGANLSSVGYRSDRILEMQRKGGERDMDADKKKQRIREYLQRELGDERDRKIQAVENLSRVGEYHGFEVWKADLFFADHQSAVWVIPEPTMNYYVHRGRESDNETEFATPKDVATFHIGAMRILQLKQRLGESELSQVGSERGSFEETLRVGQNAKVSDVAERIVERFLAHGIVELETLGAGALNQAVKAVAKARPVLQRDGYALAIVPELAQVPPGQGSQIVVRLTVVSLGS